MTRNAEINRLGLELVFNLTGEDLEYRCDDNKQLIHHEGRKK